MPIAFNNARYFIPRIVFLRVAFALRPIDADVFIFFGLKIEKSKHVANGKFRLSALRLAAFWRFDESGLSIYSRVMLLHFLWDGIVWNFNTHSSQRTSTYSDFTQNHYTSIEETIHIDDRLLEIRRESFKIIRSKWQYNNKKLINNVLHFKNQFIPNIYLI